MIIIIIIKLLMITMKKLSKYCKLTAQMLSRQIPFLPSSVWQGVPD